MQCPGLKKENTFQPDDTKLKISAEIEHILVYTRALQCLSSNMNNNEPHDEEVKKSYQKMKNKNYHVSLRLNF